MKDNVQRFIVQDVKGNVRGLIVQNVKGDGNSEQKFLSLTKCVQMFMEEKMAQS